MWDLQKPRKIVEYTPLELGPPHPNHQSEVVDGDAVYMCNLCDKEFSESNNVRQYLMNTHIDDKKQNKYLDKMCVDLKSCL